MTDAPDRPDPRDDSEATPSEGPSGFGQAETSQGGADAVPDTPDNVPEDFTGE